MTDFNPERCRELLAWWADQPKYLISVSMTHELAAQLEAALAKLDRCKGMNGKWWDEDSSLENWFPITAEKLESALAEIERLSQRDEYVSVSRDPDGEPDLDISISANTQFSLSVHHSGNISWAGHLNETRDHGVVKDERFGLMLYAMLDMICRLNPEDEPAGE